MYMVFAIIHGHMIQCTFDITWSRFSEDHPIARPYGRDLGVLHVRSKRVTLLFWVQYHLTIIHDTSSAHTNYQFTVWNQMPISPKNKVGVVVCVPIFQPSFLTSVMRHIFNTPTSLTKMFVTSHTTIFTVYYGRKITYMKLLKDTILLTSHQPCYSTWLVHIIYVRARLSWSNQTLSVTHYQTVVRNRSTKCCL